MRLICTFFVFATAACGGTTPPPAQQQQQQQQQPPQPTPARAEPSRERQQCDPRAPRQRRPSVDPQAMTLAMEGLLAQTQKTAPDRPMVAWKLAADYVDVEVAAIQANKRADAIAAGQKAIEKYSLILTDHPTFVFAEEARQCLAIQQETLKRL